MTNQKPADQSPDLSFDAVTEDLLGLNIRGLRSIVVLWANPRRYFEAARLLDWGDRYTPSIRLWLSFFALFSALKFWWFGENAGMIDAYAAGFEQAGLQLPEGVTFKDVGEEAVLFVFGLVPILQIISMVFVALVFSFWGEKTTLALRQRYLFAVIMPSTSLMPVFLTIMVFVPAQHLQLYGVFLAVSTLMIDFVTGYRGGFASVTGFQRAWRAFLLAMIVVFLNTATSIAAQLTGIISTSQQYTVIPGG